MAAPSKWAVTIKWWYLTSCILLSLILCNQIFLQSNVCHAGEKYFSHSLIPNSNCEWSNTLKCCVNITMTTTDTQFTKNWVNSKRVSETLVGFANYYCSSVIGQQPPIMLFHWLIQSQGVTLDIRLCLTTAILHIIRRTVDSPLQSRSIKRSADAHFRAAASLLVSSSATVRQQHRCHTR